MIIATTVLETAQGEFSVSTHGTEGSPERCLTISQGYLGAAGTVVRLHSSCIFGEALSACDCDCGPQLATAMQEVDKRGSGTIVYLYQEGRGAGLDLKIQGMERQRIKGINSYQAYESLGLPRDMRDYSLAGTALADLGFAKTVTLMSNNPTKRSALERLGYVVESQFALSYTVSQRAYDYLKMKQVEGEHSLDFDKIDFVH
ncbi:GTP cyclohydrolase II [Streptomyces violaceoruber]|uniref:GTP cyclohydrolase II n=1 Tax=Streptomyces violaceoruber TaxID=1935 RepID=UPI001F2D8DBD|nr:GTP cyclohydrolase II [Streptomyces violaceoruber]MCF3165788.1 GTP cyclohydrolase II [Streptomyces violaceoruber]